MAPPPSTLGQAAGQAGRRPGGIRRVPVLKLTRSVTFSDFGESDAGESEPPRLDEVRLQDLDSPRPALPETPTEPEELEVVPLLKVYMPAARAAGGHFQVLLRRASLEQPYGVSFLAASTGDRLSCITVDEDLPHLGLRKSARLVTINGVSPESVKECGRILNSAFVVALVLEAQRGRALVEAQRWDSPRRGAAAGHASPRGDTGPQLLLHSTRPQVLNAEKGTFKLSLVRASLHQRFGVSFTTKPGARAGSKATIHLVQDLPHLGLMAGDQLLVINGRRATDSGVCQRVLQNTREITLEMRRHPSKLNRLVPQVESIEDNDWVDAVHISEHQCWACTSGLLQACSVTWTTRLTQPGGGHVPAAPKEAQTVAIPPVFFSTADSRV